ncbi:MAG: 2-oxoacid:acceptor oxidoreductase family protein [Oscillospiraceae bacterium]
MTEIRWHGRGGQGAFTAARLLGGAVSIHEGKYALAFPSFGPERRGAPVFAFTRIDTENITDRSEVVACDCAVVLDDTLFGDPVKNGLKPGATVIINTTKDASRFPVENCKVVTVDATGLALEILGRPITNVPLLGALIAATGITTIAAVEAAIDDQMGVKIREKNKKLLNRTYEIVKERV